MAKQIKRFFNYNPETGVITWRKQNCRWRPVGSAVGSISKKDGYCRLSFDGKQYLAHRIIWFLVTGKWPRGDVDHINGDRSDNRWSNLREATRAQNLSNAKLLSRNLSGYKGVTYSKSRQCFVAQICVNYRTMYLGGFPDAVSAHDAYVAAAIKYRSEFARAA